MTASLIWYLAVKRILSYNLTYLLFCNRNIKHRYYQIQNGDHYILNICTCHAPKSFHCGNSSNKLHIGFKPQIYFCEKWKLLKKRETKVGCDDISHVCKIQFQMTSSRFSTFLPLVWDWLIYLSEMCQNTKYTRLKII